jgi:hypothetical protein
MLDPDPKLNFIFFTGTLPTSVFTTTSTGVPRCRRLKEIALFCPTVSVSAFVFVSDCMPIPDQNRFKHQHKGGWGRGFVAKLCHHKFGVFICVIWSFFLLIVVDPGWLSTSEPKYRKSKPGSRILQPVLGIRKILVRIRNTGSVHLPNGSEANTTYNVNNTVVLSLSGSRKNLSRILTNDITKG